MAGTANIGDVDVLTLPALPAGTNNIGDVDVLSVPAPLSTTGNGTAATALRVVLATDTRGPSPATSALTNVASSATNVTILASNTGRMGASVFNDSTQSLYLKFGTTASATSFTVLMLPNSYFEVPFGYTGIIDGLWSSATGSARVTEVTA